MVIAFDAAICLFIFQLLIFKLWRVENQVMLSIGLTVIKVALQTIK